MAEDVDLDEGWVGRVRARLAGWYDRGHRDLPWRRVSDPYAILVSEAMLVQTTVAAVVPHYGRFLARFPTVEALAGADEADVLKAWEGLGYYRRARQLHQAARAVVDRHGGAFPSEPGAILALPGVGRYIAGAILSFAFDRRAPIVEANTQRVLARWLAWPGEIGTSATQARLWLAAGRLVPELGPGRFNQAIMELGAVVCVPRAPLCLACPVAADCRARALGLQDRIPAVKARPKPLAAREAVAVIAREGRRVLMLKRGVGALWEKFWEFPTLHLSGANPAGRAVGDESDLGAGFRALTGVEARVGPEARVVRFGVTKHRVELSVRPSEWIGGEPGPPAGFEGAAWVDLGDLAGLTLSAPTRALARWVAGPDPIAPAP